MRLDSNLKTTDEKYIKLKSKIARSLEVCQKNSQIIETCKRFKRSI